MSTQERIKQEAELIPEKLGWVNDGTSEPQDIKRAYALGALSERNKTIEQMEIILTRILHTSYHLPEVLKNLESLKV